MNQVIEKELRHAVSDWAATMEQLNARSDEMGEWLEETPPEQFLIVGDDDTSGLAHWGARTFGLISKKLNISTTESAILDNSPPPEDAQKLSTLILFLSRRGGSRQTASTCKKLDEIYPLNRKLALSSRSGILSELCDKSLIFSPPELTATPTLTPTRLMVAMMRMGALLADKEVLAKRAELLGQWYMQTPARSLARMVQNSRPNIHIAAPKRLFSHCLPIKQVVEAYTKQTQPMIDIDKPKGGDREGIVLGITAKSSEEQDLKNLATIQSAACEVIAFCSGTPKEFTHHISLSRRTTDIGRTIHATLNIQKLLLCMAAREGGGV